jgi:hypothetical protein
LVGTVEGGGAGFSGWWGWGWWAAGVAAVGLEGDLATVYTAGGGVDIGLALVRS